MIKRTLSLLLIPAVVAACAAQGYRDREQAALERHLDHAGEPVSSFSYIGRITGWRTLGEDKVVIYTRVNDAYLLTVAQPCTELDYANNIGLTSTGSTVSARFDSVIVDGRRCQITEIRPVDYGAVRQAAREEREERKTSRY